MAVPCRPNGRTFTISNFNIKTSRVRTVGMIVWTVDLMHAISISDARSSEHLDLNCDTCLMDERVQTGIHVVRTAAAIFL
jgi:histidinol dehydrogenase